MNLYKLMIKYMDQTCVLILSNKINHLKVLLKNRKKDTNLNSCNNLKIS